MSKLEEIQKQISFVGGAFIDSQALPTEGVEVTVKALVNEEIENMRTFKKEKKPVLYFDEFDLGFVLGAKTNRLKYVSIAKSKGKTPKEMKGEKITIYRDPTVKFGKNVVGAIRIK